MKSEEVRNARIVVMTDRVKTLDLQLAAAKKKLEILNGAGVNPDKVTKLRPAN